MSLSTEVKLLKHAAQRDRLAFVCVAVVLVLCALAGVVFAQAQIDRVDHERIVSVLEGQLDLLRYLGSAIVVGLASAVAVLYRALEKSNERCQQETREAIHGLRSEIRRWRP